jgi:hypothetical protein
VLASRGNVLAIRFFLPFALFVDVFLLIAALHCMDHEVNGSFRGFRFCGLMSGIYPAQEPGTDILALESPQHTEDLPLHRPTPPQLVHRYPEAAVKINERIVRPEPASQFLPADDFSWVSSSATSNR